MASSYQTVIKKALQEGGLLDALLALQKRDGYVTEEALNALAEHEGKSPAELYDTASFYSMLRFSAPAKKEIRVCRGTLKARFHRQYRQKKTGQGRQGRAGSFCRINSR